VAELASAAQEPDSEFAEAAEFYREAGIFAEFGKIVCVSLGRFTAYDKARDKRGFRVTNFVSRSEEELLTEMESHITRMSERETALGKFGKPEEKFKYCFVGHNIKEFDIPYLCRRMMVHGICLPDIIDCAGLKPWETPQFIDTMELWKFGDNKSYTSLDLLAARFGIASPKEDMDGSMVYQVFYEDQDMQRLGRYCASDVVTTASLMLKWRQERPLEDFETDLITKLI
jgi:DNA polymerase elongation subunit (family B)